MNRRGAAFEFIARASTQEASIQQLDIVEDLITLGVDYIIVGPIDYFGIVPALKSANDAGIPSSSSIISISIPRMPVSTCWRTAAIPMPKAGELRLNGRWRTSFRAAIGSA